MAPRRKFDFKFKERVLQFAEKTSGEEAARNFNIDSKRIRYWRKQKSELLLADKRRARLAGGGRKKVSVELERKLSEWIYSMWDQHNPVSGKMIQNKALEIYPSVRDGGKVFVASRSWLRRFLQRNNLSLQHRTTVIQNDPDQLTEKLVSFVDYVGKAVSSNGILERDIIAMDETAVWFDTVSPITVDTQGKSSEAMPGHENLTVVLAAKADGTKLQPYIVFRGAAGEVRQQISGAVIAKSANGWMNDALTADWLQSVVGQFNMTPRLLVWDSYRCHIGAATKAELKHGYNITTAVIPGGCTKHIQASNMMWNQIFKQSLYGAYNQWLAGDTDKEYTAGGYLKAPARHLLVDWVVAAWDNLDEDLIRESFKVCGLSVKSDGSEDDLILCFQEGQPCDAGREALAQVRQRSLENQCQTAQDEEDEEELFNNELVVFDDDEEEDFGEEDSDHMSWHCFIHQALPSNDIKQIIIKEEQQEWSPSEHQEDPEPPHIKEEQEEVRTSQEGEQLQGFTFTPVPVKSEDDDDEEKPQSSQLHQIQFEQMETDNGEDCGGPEPARTSDPDTHLKPDSSPNSSDPDTDDSEDWKRTREPQSASNHLQVPLSCVPCISHETRFLLHSCSQCGKGFGNKTNLKVHMRTHTGEKPFNCLVCGKTFAQGEDLRQHMAVHRGKRLRCTVCDRRFIWYQQFKTHKCVGLQSSQLHQRQTERMKADGEDCKGPEAARNSDPDRHLEHDTDDMTEDSSESETDNSDDGWKETRDPQSGHEAPVSCITRTGENQLNCSECGKRFGYMSLLKRHVRIHTGEKPFSCSVCSKRFIQKSDLQVHKRTHTWRKIFSCSVCDQRFSRRSQIKIHECDHRKASQPQHNQADEFN
ncbi:zinc finger and SCAN domain-containing protein 12 [Dicentrarchus labrax]|uniref:Uncharacterized protein n=1 Tax=Dicentrarchus labrax TaxID=13489 RepID=A0A8P4GDX8_DICLA|nr:zinc finger and SCAN domain-containing protein 12 [Dicentrarchus labrax]